MGESRRMSSLTDINTPPFSIADREVGPGQPVYVIAEIGLNHNGRFDSARRLIDIAVNARADAVKFQKRHVPSLYTHNVLHELGNQEQPLQYLLPILQEFELSEDEIGRLKEHCEASGITFLCTPFDIPSARFLKQLSVTAFKVASCDVTNVPLLAELASYAKPIIMSTGMSLDHELDHAVAFLRQQQAKFTLLHCVSAYPVDPREALLSRIPYLARRYGVPVGYSGHDVGIALSIVAVSLGACIVEKHITLDQKQRGPDHKFSLLPKELKRLVSDIRESELALTPGMRTEILQGEAINRFVLGKSVVAAAPIAQGEQFSTTNLEVRSPGGGLSPQRLSTMIGRRARRSLDKGTVLQEEDLYEDVTPDAALGFGWGKWGLVVRYHDFVPALRFKPETLEFHLTHADTLLDVPEKALELHKKQLADCILRVHCCEYIGERLFDLVSMYPEVVDASVQTLQRVIDITERLSAWFPRAKPLVVFNVGAMSLKTDTRPLEVDPATLYQAISKLRLGRVGLLAQNMPPGPWYFGGQWKGHYFLHPQELLDFAKETGQGVCLDLSHAYMASRYLGMPFEEMLLALQPVVGHIHVADSHSLSSEGLPISQGKINFRRFFEIFRSYSGSWVPEIWLGHRNDFAGFRSAMHTLKAVFQSKQRDPEATALSH